jgi:hypothetical protein
MRETLCILALLLPFGGVAGFGQGFPDSTDSRIGNPRIRHELLAMEEIDQKARNEWIGRMSFHTVDSAFVAKIESVDRANTARMKEIVARFGWPGQKMVGVDGAEAAFLLVQHADRDTAFQNRCLTLVQQAFAEGDASGQSLALLTDRVRVHQGRPQLYGSQTRFVDHTVLVDPIEDEVHVDERRARLGLPPMAEYLKLLKEMYHLEKK